MLHCAWSRTHWAPIEPGIENWAGLKWWEQRMVHLQAISTLLQPQLRSPVRSPRPPSPAMEWMMRWRLGDPPMLLLCAAVEWIPETPSLAAGTPLLVSGIRLLHIVILLYLRAIVFLYSFDLNFQSIVLHRKRGKKLDLIIIYFDFWVPAMSTCFPLKEVTASTSKWHRLDNFFCSGMQLRWLDFPCVNLISRCCEIFSLSSRNYCV